MVAAGRHLCCVLADTVRRADRFQLRRSGTRRRLDGWGRIAAVKRAFAVLDAVDRQRLHTVMRRRRFRRYEVVCHQGDPGDSLHVVVKGRFVATITSAVTGLTAAVNIFERDTIFGELAMIDGSPRSATISAVEPAETLELKRPDFEMLLVEHPVIERFLLLALAAQVRQMTAQISEALFDPVDKRVYRRLSLLQEVADRDRGTVDPPPAGGCRHAGRYDASDGEPAAAPPARGRRHRPSARRSPGDRSCPPSPAGEVEPARYLRSCSAAPPVVCRRAEPARRDGHAALLRHRRVDVTFWPGWAIGFPRRSTLTGPCCGRRGHGGTATRWARRATASSWSSRRPETRCRRRWRLSSAWPPIRGPTASGSGCAWGSTRGSP